MRPEFQIDYELSDKDALRVWSLVTGYWLLVTGRAYAEKHRILVTLTEVIGAVAGHDVVDICWSNAAFFVACVQLFAQFLRVATKPYMGVVSKSSQFIVRNVDQHIRLVALNAAVTISSQQYITHITHIS
jgi:hypothetical protein